MIVHFWGTLFNWLFASDPVFEDPAGSKVTATPANPAKNPAGTGLFAGFLSKD